MIKDLVLKNRSYRGFDRSTRLSREDLMELVDLSRLSPSGTGVLPRDIWKECPETNWETP